MLKVSRILIAEDYRMDHTAPTKLSGAPLYDVTLNGVYPEDFYGPNGLRYYGDGNTTDAQSYSTIRAYHNKPSAKIKIYRSIPKEVLSEEVSIEKYEKEKKYILKHGTLPPNVSPKCPVAVLTQYGTTERKKASGYYDWLCEQIEHLTSQPVEQAPKITINPGDWVSVSLAYVQEHGAEFSGGHKVLTKVVSASDIYTDGDSFNEWGYDPS